MMHPRFAVTQAAKKDLNRVLGDWQEQHDLTPIEEAQIFLGEVASNLKYALRIERHGNAGLEADLEHDSNEDDGL